MNYFEEAERLVNAQSDAYKLEREMARVYQDMLDEPSIDLEEWEDHSEMDSN